MTDARTRRPIRTEVIVSIITAIASIAVAYITTRGTIASSGAKIDDTNEKARNIETRVSMIEVPPGTISAFAGPTPPDGWLPCDGSPVNREGKYGRLFKAIGESWGHGDRVVTFNVPDLRGVFLRGVNGGRTGDYADPQANDRVAVMPGGNAKNLVGSFQSDSFKQHHHPGDNFVYKSTQGTTAKGVDNGFNTGQSAPSTGDTGGMETRPKNAYVNWIIKY